MVDGRVLIPSDAGDDFLVRVATAQPIANGIHVDELPPIEVSGPVRPEAVLPLGPSDPEGRLMVVLDRGNVRLGENWVLADLGSPMLDSSPSRPGPAIELGNPQFPLWSTIRGLAGQRGGFVLTIASGADAASEGFEWYNVETPDSGTLQRIIHPAPDGSVWSASRKRIVTRVDTQDITVTDVVAAGACPIVDARAGCVQLEPGSEGVVAHGAFWIGNPSDGSVHRIDLESAAVTDVITVGARPGTPVSTANHVWVVDHETATVVGIDGTSRQVVERIHCPAIPIAGRGAKVFPGGHVP